MSSVESSKMFKATLSQTLNSEIVYLHPYNKSLLSYKRWSDSLRPPFRGLAHKVLHKYLEWWYERPIHLHNLPIEEQVENVRKVYGTHNNKPNPDRATEYVWEGDGDWHR